MAASDRPRLESNAMGVADVVFFVLAALAPVGVVVSLTTLSIALGAGAGTPGIYLIAGLVESLFAVGYVRMSRRITNAGAFWAYVSRGLGEQPQVSVRRQVEPQHGRVRRQLDARLHDALPPRGPP